MSIHFEGGGVTVLHGDCIEETRTLPDASVHAVVTDPPYGLEFMGREWDGADGFRRSLNAADAGRKNVFGRASRTSPEYKAGEVFGEWCAAWAAECLRVLKPGGHLLAFGGSRTWHRLAVGIEEAGFELRDSIAWLYGSGMPKHSSQLKPAFEPVVVARRPMIGSYAVNHAAHGTGALNIEASRIGDESTRRVRTGNSPDFGLLNDDGWKPSPGVNGSESGRWPTNVVLDESQAAALDKQSGTLTSGMMRAGQQKAGKPAGILGEYKPQPLLNDTYGDSGGASRFFPTFEMSDADWLHELAARSLPTFRYEAKAPTSERPSVDGVQHPTVKPLDLMRWLVRLVTPPGGTVLEPFAGSGTTVEACLLEGFSCIAIEREADYLPLIMSRIQKDHEQSLFGDWGGGAA